MKFSEQWLRSHIDPPVDTHGLANQLTMAGLEVDSITPVGAAFTGVMIGEVLSVKDHPDAKRLHCCQVNIGQAQPLSIVCGATNVRSGLKVAVATVGAVLPDGLKIEQANLRGELSSGMICSAKELGLDDDTVNIGIIELPADAPVGSNFLDYMHLPDHVIDVDLTPNRSDCLSINGLARDIAVINQLAYQPKAVAPIAATIDATFEVKLHAPARCPCYLGRIIRNINPQAHTPMWMREHLRRSGIRAIHPVVDVTNYVMLEFGQPMHAFDLATLHDEIQVRLARAGESLQLLDGTEVSLDNETLVIADTRSPLAVAGIMGGAYSGVTTATQDIFLESAYFDPTAISLTARRYNLQTDSSYRFARGVDFQLQALAMERATALLLELVGGEPGPTCEQISLDHLPQRCIINLRRERIGKLLGISVSDSIVERILGALGMTLEPQTNGWRVQIPSYRFDITIEVDLIEEIARIYGYQHIPAQVMRAPLNMPAHSESLLSTRRIAQLLVDRDYHEAITYSFIDAQIHQILDPDRQPIEVSNPISADMTVMRSSLWPGLLQAMRYNRNRQIERVRLFESGLCFWQQKQQAEKWQQVMMIGGAVSGSAYPQQWSGNAREVDFYDIKGDIEALLMLTGCQQNFTWRTSENLVLHPGQQAALFNQGVLVGHLGAVHPRIAQQLDLPAGIFVFEFMLDILSHAEVPVFQPISKFPVMRRDLAITVEQDIAAADIKQYIQEIVGAELINVVIFDVYQGEKIANGQKSLAFSLTLQAISRTLTDTEINDIITNILQKLGQKFKAKLRV